MANNKANFGETTLGAAIANDSDTAITVTSGTPFPAVPFLVTIGTEILKCTDKGAGTNWTVTRGEQSSVAAAHDNGTTVQNNITAGDFSPLVEGPASVASDGNLAIYNGTTGKIIKDGGACTAAGLALLDDANAAAQIATLGLDADIATLSLPASTTITAAGAALIDDATATVQIATLGLDADIATLSLPANTTISAAGAELINDANAAAQLTTLGALPLAGGTMSGNIVMGNGGTIGQAAGPLLTFDDTNNELGITGCEVGIGTADPLDALYIAGTGMLAALSLANTAYKTWKLYSCDCNAFHISEDGGANDAFTVKTGSPDDCLIVSPAGVTINEGLHVGGTSDPGDNNLLVDGTAGITGVLTATGGIVMADGATIGQAAGPLLNFDDTNNYLEITGAKVGIGTATPAYTLDISGDAYVSGVYYGQGAAPGFWLDEDGAKGGYLVVNGGYIQIQRRATDFGAYEASPFQFNISAPTAALFVGANGYASFLWSLHVGSTSDVGDNNIYADGDISGNSITDRP